jgi:hypothetical protein
MKSTSLPCALKSSKRTAESSASQVPLALDAIARQLGARREAEHAIAPRAAKSVQHPIHTLDLHAVIDFLHIVVAGPENPVRKLMRGALGAVYDNRPSWLQCAQARRLSVVISIYMPCNHPDFYTHRTLP